MIFGGGRIILATRETRTKKEETTNPEYKG